MRRLVLAIAAFVVVALACNDYDAEQSTADAGADAALDSSLDAPDGAPDAGPQGFCATKGDAAVWCEDFDTITDVTSLVPASSVGDPELSSRQFESAPRSLKFFMPAALQSTQYSVVTHGVSTDKEMRFETDLRWEIATASDGQTLQSITLRKDLGQVFLGRACGIADAGVVPCLWYLSVDPDLSTPSNEEKLYVPPPAALQRWSHVVLQVRFGNPGHVRYEEGGEVRVDLDIATLKIPSTAPASATIGLAILQAATTHHELFFDNVFLELR